MRMVSMGMGGCGLAIGPAFRVERRFDRDAFAAERCNQRFQRMVAPQPNAIGKQLDCDVTVAENPGEPRQRRRIGSPYFEQRLRLGQHFDEPAVVEFERVAHAQMFPLGERKHKRQTFDGDPLGANFPALRLSSPQGPVVRRPTVAVV